MSVLVFNCKRSINYVSGRHSRVAFLLRQLVNILYFSTAHGLQLWGNSAEINIKLIIQNKPVRILADSDQRTSFRSLFVKESIPTVVSLYIYLCIVKVKTEIGSYALRGQFHSHNTRNSNLINTDFVRLSKTQSNSHIMSINFLK